jgi:hypothetical protein
MAWGDGKLRGPEEQGLEASHHPTPFTRALKLTVPDDEFRMATIVGWPHAQPLAGKSGVCPTPPVASACDIDRLSLPDRHYANRSISQAEILIPALPAALRFCGATAFFRFDASFLRTFGGPRLLADFRLDEGGADQGRQALGRRASILFLAALAACSE